MLSNVYRMRGGYCNYLRSEFGETKIAGAHKLQRWTRWGMSRSKATGRGPFFAPWKERTTKRKRENPGVCRTAAPGTRSRWGLWFIQHTYLLRWRATTSRVARVYIIRTAWAAVSIEGKTVSPWYLLLQIVPPSSDHDIDRSSRKPAT